MDCMPKRVEILGDLFKPVLQRRTVRRSRHSMSLPLPIDYAPMEADTAREIPSGTGMGIRAEMGRVPLPGVSRRR